MGAALLLVTTSLVFNALYSPSPLNQHEYQGGTWVLQPNAQTIEVTRLLTEIPSNAGVSAVYNVVPHLTHRDVIYSWPNPWIRANYGVNDTQPPEPSDRVDYLILILNEIPKDQTQLVDRLTSARGAFHILEQHNGVLLAVRKSYATSHRR